MFISANFHDTQKGPHMDFGSKTMKKQQQQVKSIVCLGTATRDGTGSKLWTILLSQYWEDNIRLQIYI